MFKCNLKMHDNCIRIQMGFMTFECDHTFEQHREMSLFKQPTQSSVNSIALH